MSLVYRARAFGPLANVEWTIPPGVSAVVGPNRVGKSTLLALPEFLAATVHGSLNDAVKQLFDGVTHLRNLNAPADVSPSVGLLSHGTAWEAELTVTGGAIAAYCTERMSHDGADLIVRPFGSVHGDCEGRTVQLGKNLIPHACWERYVSIKEHFPIFEKEEPLTAEEMTPITPQAAPFGAQAVHLGAWMFAAIVAARSYKTYRYQIQHLQRYGSIQSSDTTLDKLGENVFPLLRNWRDSSETEARFDFVISTLREAFPHISKVDFEQAGQTVTMAVRDRRWANKKIPISRESTGLVTALLQLCAVASGTQNGLVTIDELETSLHPHAIRVLIAAFRRWAKEHDLRIVLATQSETVLDQFHDDPGQIYVIEPGQEITPRSLTEMFDGEYLNQFSLGDLFSHLEFGSNRESPTST
jgi:ABC-type branched-subunit amino acid transport system ATPase component